MEERFRVVGGLDVVALVSAAPSAGEPIKHSVQKAQLAFRQLNDEGLQDLFVRQNSALKIGVFGAL